MTGSSVLFMLLGAALVLAGVFSSAIADRIRNHGALERIARAASASARPRRPSDQASPLRVVRDDVRDNDDEDMEADVTAALTKMGFALGEARKAVAACPKTDRHSVENWLRCALRKTAPGKAVS